MNLRYENKPIKGLIFSMALGAAALSRGRLPRWGPVAPTREEGAWRPPRRPALALGPIGTTGVTFFATGNLSAE